MAGASQSLHSWYYTARYTGRDEKALHTVIRCTCIAMITKCFQQIFPLYYKHKKEKLFQRHLVDLRSVLELTSHPREDPTTDAV